MDSMDEYIEDDELAIKENELDVPKMGWIHCGTNQHYQRRIF